MPSSSGRRYGALSPVEELEMAPMPAAHAPSTDATEASGIGTGAADEQQEFSLYSESSSMRSLCRQGIMLVLIGITAPIILTRVLGDNDQPRKPAPAAHVAAHVASHVAAHNVGGTSLDWQQIAPELMDDVCCFGIAKENWSSCAVLCPEDAAWLGTRATYQPPNCPPWPGVAPRAENGTTGRMRHCAIRASLVTVHGRKRDRRRRRHRRLGMGRGANGSAEHQHAADATPKRRGLAKGKGGGDRPDALQVFGCRVTEPVAHGMRYVDCNYYVAPPRDRTHIQLGPSTSRYTVAAG